MKETTNHKLRWPEPKDTDTLSAHYQHLAEDTERELDKIAPKQIVGATKKQLLIANASGVVTAVTASGDVTNDESGVFSIGAEKIATGMYQAASITRAKLAAPLIQTKRVLQSMTASQQLVFSLVWPTAFADTNYTVSLTPWIELASPEGEAGTFTAKMTTKSKTEIKVLVVNTTTATRTIGLEAVAFHD